MKSFPKRKRVKGMSLDFKIVNHASTDGIYHILTVKMCINNVNWETYLIVYDFLL